MSSAFRTLSLGVGSFDKSKSSFHDVFKPSGPSSSKDAAASAETKPQPVAASLPAELDFFASSSSGSGGKKAAATSSSLSTVNAATPAKKRKRPSSSSSSSAPTPSPLTPATLNPFLRQHRIKITVGADNSSNHVEYPLPLVSWSEASSRHSLPSWLVDELQSERGWDLTPIQRAALPVALEGRDLLAMAPTGSGKTLAYLVPLLHKLMSSSAGKDGEEEEEQDKGRAPRAVILSPTRELATQIFDETRRLLRARPEEEYANNGKKAKKGKKPNVPTEGGLRVSLLTGGDKIRPVTKEEAAKLPALPVLDLVIATPLRLQQAIEQEAYSLGQVHSIVLDEADTLLGSSSAFLPQVDSLLSLCTRSPSLGGVHKSLFTATLPSSVETLARSLLAPDHIRLIVGRKDSSSSDVDQALKFVGSEEGKLLELRGMVKRGEVTPPALLFVQSIERAKDLLEELAYDGLRVDAIHSDRSRKEREAVLRSFKQGKVWLLICTEVMARGLDFKGVDLVINYDLPTSTESYVHRVGRTGRAGRRGKAVSFWTKEDAPYLRSILNLIKQSGGGEVEELVPRYLLEGGAAAAAAAAAGKGGKGGAKSKAAAKRERKKLKTKPVERQAINEASGSRKLDEDRRERREGKRLRPKKGRGEQEGSSDDDSGSDDD